MTTNDYQYLALLRGINVGGNNIIKMADLKACFENMGFSDVSSFIQSGNVFFKSDEEDIVKLTNSIEKVLSDRFDYKSRIVVISKNQLRKVVEEAPPKFGKEKDLYKYDVLFLKAPFISKEAIKDVEIKEGVDFAFEGENVLYFSRLINQASKSHLIKIINKPFYQYITIRNWNTTTKLLELMSQTE